MAIWATRNVLWEARMGQQKSGEQTRKDAHEAKHAQPVRAGSFFSLDQVIHVDKQQIGEPFTQP
jgi:hypothetical protein